MRQVIHDGSMIYEELLKLPVAETFPVYFKTRSTNEEIGYQELGNFVGVKVIIPKKAGYQIIAVPTKAFTLVQHKEAFDSVIEPLTESGTPFKFSLRYCNERALLNIFVGDAINDGLFLGFQARNNVDGHGLLSFGLELNLKEHYIELVGYRQVCSNGAKIRVPLEQAEIIKPEIVEKITSLFKEQAKITHRKNAHNRLLLVPYVVEALIILRESVNKMINKAIDESVLEHLKTEEGDKTLKNFIKGYVKKRYASVVLEQFNHEGDFSFWGLYNAITYVASHDNDMSLETSELLLERAGLLLYELATKQV
jgi:hypothetical protein